MRFRQQKINPVSLPIRRSKYVSKGDLMRGPIMKYLACKTLKKTCSNTSVMSLQRFNIYCDSILFRHIK